MHISRPTILVALLVSWWPSVAHAGMPSITLTDVTRMRVQGISFFLFGLLASAKLIQWLWNYLQRDFARLPRLSYGKSVAVVSLWGLLFVVVLTMISGARELMTPGAWEKQGFTYKLADESEATVEIPAEERLLMRRKQQLERLRTELWQYAAKHDGHFPDAEELVDDIWALPDRLGMQYVYAAGLTVQDESRGLAVEPEVYGHRRLALLASGEIREMISGEIRRVFKAEVGP